MVGRRRHLGRERHQPVGLTKRPSQLLETRDPAAVIVVRRRCLPIVPAREENSGDVDLSAGGRWRDRVANIRARHCA